MFSKICGEIKKKVNAYLYILHTHDKYLNINGKHHQFINLHSIIPYFQLETYTLYVITIMSVLFSPGISLNCSI